MPHGCGRLSSLHRDSYAQSSTAESRFASGSAGRCTWRTASCRSRTARVLQAGACHHYSVSQSSRQTERVMALPRAETLMLLVWLPLIGPWKREGGKLLASAKTRRFSPRTGARLNGTVASWTWTLLLTLTAALTTASRYNVQRPLVDYNNMDIVHDLSAKFVCFYGKCGDGC